MFDKIPFRWPIFNRQSIIDSEELTALELAGRSAAKTNEVVDWANGLQDDIDSREKSVDITNNRKLSPTGDFTGTFAGHSVAQMLVDISSSISLVEELEDLVNDSRESLGYIFDGGLFTQTDSADFSLDGGMF